jgi:glutaredoxin 3
MRGENMKAFQGRGVLALTAALALVAAPAHAQLEDLFGDPGANPSGAQQPPALNREAGEPKRQARKAPPREAAAVAPEAPPVPKAILQKVVIYTTPTCPHCRRALQHMRARNIAYIQKDVKRDPANHAEFKRLGGRGVPHILMGDAVLVGFDPRHFDEQYTAWNARLALPR